MIIDIIIKIYSWIVSTLVFILPDWSIYPQTFLDGIKFFADQMAVFDIILPIHELFIALTWFIGFEVFYYTAKLVIKLHSLIRGNHIDI